MSLVRRPRLELRGDTGSGRALSLLERVLVGWAALAFGRLMLDYASYASWLGPFEWAGLTICTAATVAGMLAASTGSWGPIASWSAMALPLLWVPIWLSPGTILGEMLPITPPQLLGVAMMGAAVLATQGSATRRRRLVIAAMGLALVVADVTLLSPQLAAGPWPGITWLPELGAAARTVSPDALWSGWAQGAHRGEVYGVVSPGAAGALLAALLLLPTALAHGGPWRRGVAMGLLMLSLAWPYTVHALGELWGGADIVTELEGLLLPGDFQLLDGLCAFVLVASAMASRLSYETSQPG